MKRFLPMAFLIALLLAMPATASAASSTTEKLAARQCRADRQEKPRRFERKYGSGSRAIERCVRAEIRDARSDCRRNKRTEPAEYRQDYGTGDRAFTRCVRDELT